MQMVGVVVIAAVELRYVSASTTTIRATAVITERESDSFVNFDSAFVKVLNTAEVAFTNERERDHQNHC